MKFYIKKSASLGLAICFFVACVTIFIPRIVVGMTAWGVDDLLAICFLLFFFFSSPKWLLTRGAIVFGLWALILSQGVFCGLIFSNQYLNEIIFPTEMWQYFKRMAFFYMSANFSFEGKLSSEKVYKIFVFSVFCAGIIGLIQVMNWGGGGAVLSNVYMRTEQQLASLVDRQFWNLRVYGVAGHPNAWGGFAAFSAVVVFSGLLLRDRTSSYGRVFLVVLVAGLFLSVLNVAFSGSRGGIVSLFGGLVFLFIFIAMHSWRSTVKKIPGVIFLSLIGYFIFSCFLQDRMDFLFYRFDALAVSNAMVRGRIDQVSSSLGLLNGFTSFILGVGNAAQRAFAVSFGTEVEPIYLLVNYGLLGAALRYLVLILIFTYAYRLYKVSFFWDRTLALATMGGIISYLAFSMGYFFFQELYVGTFPWLLFGWVSGKYYANREGLICSPKLK